MIYNNHSTAKPFIKWVGGKGQLLKQLEQQLPHELYNEDFTYVEPFVGGGAMLFFILQKFHNVKRVIINDINRNLTEAYRVIKQKPEGAGLSLEAHRTAVSANRGLRRAKGILP